MIDAAPFPAPSTPTATASESAPSGPRRPYSPPRLTIASRLEPVTRKFTYSSETPLIDHSYGPS